MLSFERDAPPEFRPPEPCPAPCPIAHSMAVLAACLLADATDADADCRADRLARFSRSPAMKRSRSLSSSLLDSAPGEPAGERGDVGETGEVDTMGDRGVEIGEVESEVRGVGSAEEVAELISALSHRAASSFCNAMRAARTPVEGGGSPLGAAAACCALRTSARVVKPSSGGSSAGIPAVFDVVGGDSTPDSSARS